MVETGLNETALGKLILAACFVNHLGTVIVLGLLFTNFGTQFWIFIAITIFALFLLPKITPGYLRRVKGHTSEPEVKYVYLVLLLLAYFASRGGSEGVLPAYVVGMLLADTFLSNRDLIKQMRANTFYSKVAEEARTKLNGRGISAQFHIEYGKPGGVILRLAEKFGVDLIVLGTKPHSALARRVLGATVDKVVDYAHCSVLVVRSHS